MKLYTIQVLIDLMIVVSTNDNFLSWARHKPPINQKSREKKEYNPNEEGDIETPAGGCYNWTQCEFTT